MKAVIPAFRAITERTENTEITEELPGGLALHHVLDGCF
jgi:hypothetical protein